MLAGNYLNGGTIKVGVAERVGLVFGKAETT